jgi:hypothetical protein
VLLVVAAADRELAFVPDHETFCCGIGPVEAALQICWVRKSVW